MTDTKMTEFGVTAAHLDQMDQITVASGKAPGKTVWTELGVYYRRGYNRPFVAVVQGKIGADAPAGFVPKFKHMTAGTLERALSWFESSQLADQLALGIPVDAAERYPSSNEAAAVNRAVREAIEDGVISGTGKLADAILGTGRMLADPVRREGSAVDRIMTDRIPIMPPGDRIRTAKVEPAATLLDCLIWLYPDATSPSAAAALVEHDFGMPARTVRNALAIERGEGIGKNGPWVAMFVATMRHFDRSEWLEAKKEAAENKAGAGAENLATIANDEG